MFWTIIIISIVIIFVIAIKIGKNYSKSNYEEYELTNHNFPPMFDGKD